MAADIDDVMHSLAEDMSTALPTNFSVDTSTVGGVRQVLRHLSRNCRLIDYGSTNDRT